MNEDWYEVDFIHLDKHQSLLQDCPVIFSECGQTCLHNQSYCRILKWEISHKGLDGLP